MPNEKNIFITGAGGFVGANLAHHLVKKYDVHIITRQNSSLWRLHAITKKIDIHEGLLEDKNKLIKVFKKFPPYAIYHLATYGAYPNQQDLNRMISVNIKCTQNLLEALKDIPYVQMVITGSSSEYGKKKKAMKESDRLDPNNFYAITKASQTYLCRSYSESLKKPLTIFRLFNVYGYYEEKGRLVRSVIESALKKKPILLATGKEARDLIFIDDVVQAYMFALTKTRFYGEVFNIGTGIQTTILQLTKKIVTLIGNNNDIQLGVYPGRVWDTYHWKADMNKTKNVFGWYPKTSLNDGLVKTILWYKKNQ